MDIVVGVVLFVGWILWLSWLALSLLRSLFKYVRRDRSGFAGGVVSTFEVMPDTPPFKPPPLQLVRRGRP